MVNGHICHTDQKQKLGIDKKIGLNFRAKPRHHTRLKPFKVVYDLFVFVYNFFVFVFPGVPFPPANKMTIGDVFDSRTNKPKPDVLKQVQITIIQVKDFSHHTFQIQILRFEKKIASRQI